MDEHQHRTPAEIADAAAHLRALMASMYEGRSVRTPNEFKADLSALLVAAEVMEATADEVKEEAP